MQGLVIFGSNQDILYQLMHSRPNMDLRGYRLPVMKGQVPSFGDLPSGCKFHPRCDDVMDICSREAPPMQALEHHHFVRCHLYPHKGKEQSKPHGASVGESPPATSVLLEVQHIWVGQQGEKSNHYLLQDLSFPIYAGRILAVVGESGSGKSTLASTLVRFLPCARGEIRYQQGFRPRDIQIVFQDPSSSLNPRWLIQNILQEAGQATPFQQILQMLEAVQMPRSCLKSYPHELSGGQRQRICIARALLAQPKLLICDEPTSALDISVQAQILNLLQDLQQALGFTCVFITHDLDVVSYFADDLLILRDGKMVEYGPLLEIWHQPKMQYTQELLAATNRF